MDDFNRVLPLLTVLIVHKRTNNRSLQKSMLYVTGRAGSGLTRIKWPHDNGRVHSRCAVGGSGCYERAHIANTSCHHCSMSLQEQERRRLSVFHHRYIHICGYSLMLYYVAVSRSTCSLLRVGMLVHGKQSSRTTASS